MNLLENNLTNSCNITRTTASAHLNLSSTQQIHRAYLYWAGSGTGDFSVKLNDSIIKAQRNFDLFQNDLPYFAAFANVTQLVQQTGNGIYTLSDLDVTPFLSPSQYCNNRTNFAGWTLVIVYQDENLPQNQINIYDGLQGVSQQQQNLTLRLENLFVRDNANSKVGFVAWEGDVNLPSLPIFTEALKINGYTLSNDLNPPNNAFNGTNSFTGETNLYNMDLDVYDIQDYISAGNTSAEITLTSQQDFVMISTVVTKLNSQLPDAIIAIDSIETECNSRRIIVHFTVTNYQSTALLRAGVPIAIYANDEFIEYAETFVELAIDESHQDRIWLEIPDYIPNNFELKLGIDDLGNGEGIVNELIETNNIFIENVTLPVSPEFNVLPNLQSCNIGFGAGIFDFSEYENFVKTEASQLVAFFENEANAVQNIFPIWNTNDYRSEQNPKEIFVRISNDNCFSITSFWIDTKNCPPTVYNALTPNGDGYNDFFFIDGLQNIFTNYELFIFNRWGKLVWTGNHQSENWTGNSNNGVHFLTENLAAGTYFYILYLNDKDYPDALNGFVFLQK
ncbi:T9SS type B sorting domain-containing protein [Flavobacterium sp. NST-5]|uniref:T9SS type B sorting domain-containing protein n=2 Tax=Flavobacterium ichthyis TaxID=2698827 RepID=A0ABW9ZB26_9FLAO|nr:T9SS type B sorting domain-containing protein [Flavobacterium ichthyis]